MTGTTSSDGVSLNNRNFRVAGYNPDPMFPNTFNEFMLTQFEPIPAPPASPTSTELSYSYDIDFTPIQPDSVNIWIGSANNKHFNHTEKKLKTIQPIYLTLNEKYIII